MEFEEIQKQQEEARKAALAGGGAQVSEGEITLRERFLRTMHYQTVDMIPNFEFGYWTETLHVWREQGLPEWVVDEKTAYDYFGIESYHVAGADIGIGKVFEAEVIEETEEKVISRDQTGVISEINKQGNQSIPHFLDFPVKDRESWLPFKKSLLERCDAPLPANWDELVAGYNRRDYPLGVDFGSLIGRARNIIGFENTALMVCEDAELLEDIVETFTVNAMARLEKVLPHVRFDFAAGWEDICFNSGPVVGVPFFYDILAPRYKRLTDLLNLHGVDIVYTDCDGNLEQVVGAFMQGGVNTLFPCEVHGGTDPVLLREQFGRPLRVWGGIDKMMFLKDKKAVDAELQRLLPKVKEGGFIPTVDHRVQADAKLDLYKHYLDRKREWFRCGGEPKY